MKHIWSAGRPIAWLNHEGEAEVGVLRRRTRVSISASPTHRLLIGRGAGEAKAKMGREITCDVETLSQFRIAYWQPQESTGFVFRALPTALPFAFRIRY